MWVPESVEEITCGKRQIAKDLNLKKAVDEKDIDIARDLAAMSTDGGVVVYGVDPGMGEPVPSPIKLEGLSDRIRSVASSSIKESPKITISCHQTQDEPSSGYLVVEVPMSPRAPHMVIAEDDRRFYGRSETSNERLTEKEVAALYERRLRLSSPKRLVDAVIQGASSSPGSRLGCMYLVASPIDPNGRFIESAWGRPSEQEERFRSMLASTSGKRRPQGQSSDFGLGNVSRLPSGWLAHMKERPSESRSRARILDLHVSHGGTFCLFFGEAATLSQLDDQILCIHTREVADLVWRFIDFIGSACNSAQYSDSLRIGVEVTGIRDGFSTALLDKQDLGPWASQAFPNDAYRNSILCDAGNLASAPSSVADDLAGQFFLATDGADFKPFDSAT